MGVKPGYATMDIDYASLACFWYNLTDEQKKLMKHEQFDFLPEDTKVKKKSIIIVWKKLTKAQKKLMKCGFFDMCKVKRRATHAQKRWLLEIQNRHETIVNQKIINKKISIAKKIKRPGSPSGPRENWSTYKLAKKIGHAKCWYTGEECDITVLNVPWAATREHIIPQAYGWTGRNKNTAIAANFVNNMLGCAPIHVKMRVKSELNKISCFPTLSGEQKEGIYKRIIKNVLNQYKVSNSMPWDNPHKSKKDPIKIAYDQHMAIQQNYVDNIEKNCDNIRDYLEEICDGMETEYEQTYGLG